MAEQHHVHVESSHCQQQTEFSDAATQPLISQMVVPSDNDATPSNDESMEERVPYWKRPGFVPRSKAEQRRIRNAKLRRILKPKNAMSVLKELKVPAHVIANSGIISKDVSQQFMTKVKADQESLQLPAQTPNVAAAEKLLANIFVKKINELWAAGAMCELGSTQTGDNPDEKQSENKNGVHEHPYFPWAQLGSYAMHKLLENWKSGGAEISEEIDRSFSLGPASSSESLEDWKSEGIEIPDGIIDEMFTSGPSISSLIDSKMDKPKASIISSVVGGPLVAPMKTPSCTVGMHPASIVNQMFPGIKITEDPEFNYVKYFRSTVTIGPNMFCGEGKSKKDARKACCVQILNHYNIPY